MKLFEDLCNHIVEITTNKSVVLGVGAGAGLCPEVNIIAEHVKELIGVDPSKNITNNQYVTSYIQDVFEDAPIENNSIDLIYSIYVLEHIDKPSTFFEKCYNLLRPGGRVLGITVNDKHYFALFSKLADMLNIKKFYINRIMKKKYNVQYGFKTYYSANNEAKLNEVLHNAGFKDIKTDLIAENALVLAYFPSQTKIIPLMLTKFFGDYDFTKNVLYFEAVK